MCFIVQEIEAIEEQWRNESAELVTAVGRLQDENKRLRRTINAPADGKLKNCELYSLNSRDVFCATVFVFCFD